VNALATIRETEGLDHYLEEIEQGLVDAVGRHPGLAATVGAEALCAGGKRLRPLLVFLAASSDREPPYAAGVAVELVHMATLVHDDLIDRAGYRRGCASAWARYGPRAARAAGDYLFARAFAELSRTGDEHAVSVLASACLCLARGEALQRAQARDPETTVESYLERCALKTGKLFEAACLLGADVTRADATELADFGLALGIAFQIADDILDCTGDALDTGKIAGTDLREGTPTLPLLLAARKDAVVREALAGGSLEGALVRVAATGALDRSRAVAFEYAERARACLDGELHREELEAMTYAVVERDT
jgi:geranylgeranyl pyrophosphate synthase